MFPSICLTATFVTMLTAHAQGKSDSVRRVGSMLVLTFVHLCTFLLLEKVQLTAPNEISLAFAGGYVDDYAS